VTEKLYVGAQALLEDRGFTVGPRVVGAATGKEPDTVVAQDPAGESSAPKGSPVNLTIDPGVVVPDLLTPQVDGIAGIKTLQSAGLDIGTIGSACRGNGGQDHRAEHRGQDQGRQGHEGQHRPRRAVVNVNGRQTCRLIIRPDVLTSPTR
jgi:hypothetical protein